MLVAVEGCDSMGKSTLINELSKLLPHAVVTKEPGSPHIEANKLIRKIVLEDETLEPFCRELLFYSDGLSHKNWINARGNNQLVLTDRGMLTHFAYLYGYMAERMLGSDPDENYSRYQLCKKLIATSCIAPNAVIYLQGDLTLMDERKRTTQDAIEKLPRSFFASVIAQFDDLLEDFKAPKIVLNARNALEANVSQAYDFICAL